MTALRQAIAQVLGLPSNAVRESYQPAETGDTAFLTVGIFTSERIGQSQRFDGSKQVEYIKTSYETTVSVNAFGCDAVEVSQTLATAMGSSFMQRQLKKLDAGLVRLSPVRNLTTNIGGGYEERGQFDMVISHNHTVMLPLGRADTVDIHLHKGY